MPRSRWIAALALSFVTLGEAAAGEVRGVVRYEGASPPAAPLAVTKDQRVCGTSVPDESLLVAAGRLANAVVVVRGAPAPAAAGAPVLDQKACRFVPHVQVAPRGAAMALLNGDPLLHGVHGWADRATRFDVPLADEGARGSARLDRSGPIAVRCDVHAWMSAWVFVVEAPAAVTGADGAFAIGGVPPGTYTVTTWHERLGERAAQVTVPAEGVARVDFVYGG